MPLKPVFLTCCPVHEQENLQVFLTWALMAENGCHVECERVHNSEALGGILLKKIPENQNVILFLGIFQSPTKIFVRLANPNVNIMLTNVNNMGPYGKTTRVPLGGWVLYNTRSCAGWGETGERIGLAEIPSSRRMQGIGSCCKGKITTAEENACITILARKR